MFGLFGKKEKPATQSLSFDQVPDGKYNAKLVHEIGGDIGGEDTILFSFLITDGEYNGQKVPATFTGKKVKKEFTALIRGTEFANTKWIRKNLGQYASTNTFEMMAELFATVTKKGYKIGSLPKVLEDFVDRMLKEG